MQSLIIITQYLASAGGGGSGGGGGGGSGGGDGGFFVLVGYVPSYFLGKLIKKFLTRKIELIVSAAFASCISLMLLIIGLSAGLVGSIILLEIVVGIWAGWAAAFFGAWDKLRKRSKVARKKLEIAKGTDSAWDETIVTERAKSVFVQYQQDWSNFNIENMKSYLSPRYLNHVMLLQAALKQLGRANRMSGVAIKKCMIVDINDDENNQNDSFDVAFEATANDELLDQSGAVTFSHHGDFVETWRYIRNGDNWLLDGITPQTSDIRMTNNSLKNLATQNNMYYSLDMGRLLVPNNGVIFGKNQFQTGDINNHVIGMYDNNLIQLYTYSNTADKFARSWLIVQIALPKSYGGIILQPKKKFINYNSAYLGIPKGKGYQKYSFEWPDFNRRYEVQATDADRMAAFELINPSFMAYLYDNDPGVGIEVVDNIVYIFKPMKSGQAEPGITTQYQTMFNILIQAFKELKM